MNGKQRAGASLLHIHREAPAAAAVAILILAAHAALAAAPGLDAYRNERFGEAYEQFQQTLKEHPNTHAADKLHFDAGAAAYKMKDYGKALQSFSQALLSTDRQLQSRSHYNLGNTLYQRGETQKGNDKKLGDWQNALQHYEQTLKIEPENKEAKENAEFVKKKIEELKQQQEQQPSPTPSPSPSPQSKKDQKKQDQQQKDQQKQQQDQSGSGDDKKPERRRGSVGRKRRRIRRRGETWANAVAFSARQAQRFAFARPLGRWFAQPGRKPVAVAR